MGLRNISLQKKTVRIAVRFGTENGQDDAEEEGHQTDARHGHDAPLADVALARSRFRHQDHPQRRYGSCRARINKFSSIADTTSHKPSQVTHPAW